MFLIQAVMPNHVWFSPCRADLLAPWENAGQMHILVHVAGYLAYVVPVPTVLECLVVFGFWIWILAFWLAPLTFVTFVLRVHRRLGESSILLTPASS